ncbi:MAG TPA: alcohol dehydrogenase catalytic domain-containing protein, partial [Acidimicrobiales bacterium]
MKALVFERNLPRFAASRVASLLGSGRGVGVGPLRLLDIDAPALPGPDWRHVTPVLSGICGSDLATLDGRSSRYFEDLVSFPFVPGHEVVGTVDDDGVAADGRPLAAGSRVVLEPVACAVHAVLAAGLRDGDTVAVLGAGTVGLAVVAALAHLAATGRVPTPTA